MTEITEERLDELRQRISGGLSPKRFRHVAAVEEMITRMCGLYCPELTMPMRAAALLHDVTKELSTEEQCTLCRRYHLPLTDADLLAPKTFHARTAAALIPDEYPDFADPLILSAVRWHTTGHAGMTLTEKLLYLSDYIDESREFRDCVILRRFFWGANPGAMDRDGRERLLSETMLLSYEMTVRDLLSENRPITAETIEARNELLLEQAKRSNANTPPFL